MRKLVGLAAIVVVALAVAVPLSLRFRGSDEGAYAQGSVHFDIDPDITGNTARSIGPGGVEDCVRVDVAPESLGDGAADATIDVVVQGDTLAPVAYDAWVIYEPTNVDPVSWNDLIKLPGAASMTAKAAPQLSGGVGYLSGAAGRPGDGTLLRIDLDVISAGVASFSFAKGAYLSAAGAHPTTTTGTGQLAINQDCPAGGQGAGPAASPTPTRQPGICPTPVRPTAEELGPPPTPIWEQPVQGGVPYSEGYVTVRLPAGREFSIVSYWSHDESGILIEIGDVQLGSGLVIRGEDGCERARFVRQPAADAVFDEIMGSLEIGLTYACPLPVRTTYEDPPVPVGPPPADGSGLPGERVQGGVPFKFGQTALQLPAGREFLVGGGLSDPGGPFFAVYDIQTRSSLFLRPDGCETSRMIWDPAADAVFDGIVGSLRVPAQ